MARVKIDDAKLKDYYDSHLADFRTPERVRAEYVVLSADNLAKQEPVTEEELKKAYEARASAFRVEEQRRASHILVKTKEEADKIGAELKKNPGAFAELAKKQSQDPGSAEKGGDLGWFGHGMMVKPFEDAVFGMKPAELRVAQSEFGFHVIKLTGTQEGKTRPFEEVKQELAAELSKQKGAKKYGESADAFGNMVYEQSESLKPVAERMQDELLRKVVAADVAKLPTYVGLPIGGSAYVILRISKVVPGQPADDPQRGSRVASAVGQAEFEAFLASLKERSDISINTRNLEKK